MAEKQYDNSNSGIMYRNEKKDEAHPNWADFQGSIDVSEPGEYWLSAWVKEGKSGKMKGKKFFSLSFRKKEGGGDGGSSSRGSGQSEGGSKPSDDIPF